MPTSRASRGRAGPSVADELRALLLDRAYPHGQVFGTESSLSQQFGVSRPNMREVLRTLEAEGLIAIVRGVRGGVMARTPDQRTVARATALVLQSHRVEIGDVFDAYAMIEPAAARSLAGSSERAVAAEVLRVKTAEQLAVINEPTSFNTLRREFHSELVTHVGNQTVRLMIATLNEVIDQAATHSIRRSRRDPRRNLEAAIGAQDTLADLIEDGDGATACEHWAHYLATLRPRFMREHGHTPMAALTVSPPSEPAASSDLTFPRLPEGTR